MNHPGPPLLSVLALLAGSAVDSIGDRVDGVFRFVVIFAFIGTALAYRRYQRAGTDPFPIITRWSWVGLGAGLLLEGLRLLVS